MEDIRQTRCDCGNLIYGRDGDSLACNSCGQRVEFEPSIQSLRAKITELEAERDGLKVCGNCRNFKFEHCPTHQDTWDGNRCDEWEINTELTPKGDDDGK